ncbi:hypothetical protein PV10_02876 [Exophiala mesophila]|uniref:Aminotransferase n=2 Tax=Exophiala mesophila TaxID=212818 RepID=A0A0D1Y3I5_EXOME|nr:uncharacterized protein PV10_02876 [Exophiala mesophila]KIV95196.1 hypothetical protein PV10_02876 [Exophiala mesophila]
MIQPISSVDGVVEEDVVAEGNTSVQQKLNGVDDTHPIAVSALIHRSLHSPPPQVVSAKGQILTFSDGRQIWDTTCGAAVACLGYGNQRVQQAIIDQTAKFSYVNSMFFGTDVAEQLANEVIRGTGGKMSKAYFLSSGSEAMDAAMKLARQYYLEVTPAQPSRINFIARQGSYHGNTWGSLAMSGHVARRKLFEPMLMTNIGRVSACYAYRGMKPGQTEAEYVQTLADELDAEFQRLGPETVIGFVAEPVVGATLGAVPAVPGYFQAMKKVCDKYGALLILDEVMSGMGRCGSLHEWQSEGVVPDIQTMAKGLGAGYAPIAAVLANERVVDALYKGTGAYSHGHTYQAYPASCAAALEVQKIIREENLIEKVKSLGDYLGETLHELLDPHPHVGDVRGKGLMWGIEFVQSKHDKSALPRSQNVALRLHEFALQPKYSISLYPGSGSVDGVLGDHVLLAPAFTATREEILKIAQLTRDAIFDFFESES